MTAGPTELVQLDEVFGEVGATVVPLVAQVAGVHRLGIPVRLRDCQ